MTVQPVIADIVNWVYINYINILIIGVLIALVLVVCLAFFNNQKATNIFRKTLLYVVCGMLVLSLYLFTQFLIETYFKSDTSNSDTNKTSKHIRTMPML